MTEKSFKETRIKNLIQLYYSRKEIQNVIYEFCKHREAVPSFMMEGFGKRPDTFEYPGDIFELVKKGATSFHCSEEIWEDPRILSTNMNEEELNKNRTGWDLLIDIDSKYIDYSKVMAKIIIEFMNFHGVKNIGIKFSGSKGFHIIVPYKAFPKEVAGISTSEKFPEYPRIIVKYIMRKINDRLAREISNLEKPSKYIKDFSASKEVMPDLVLVSSRHLFRAPYSLHEKTALCSVVLSSKELDSFDLKDADPMKIKIKNFYPDSREDEAKELLIQALDWHKQTKPEPAKKEFKSDFKPIKIDKLSDEFLPPTIQKILKGVADGRKRALFILLGLFRSIGMDVDEIDKRIEDWNKKNKVPLKQGYIKAQLSWAYRNKPALPPNFDKDYYKGIGVVPTPEEIKAKNPVNWVQRKAFINERKNKTTKK